MGLFNDAPRIEVAGRPTDADLRAMSYRAALQWAADDDGYLIGSKLKRLARVREYNPSWVPRNAGKHWQDVLEEARLWARQLAESGR